MKVLIGIPCLSMVHTQFMASLLELRKPQGTKIAIESDSLTYFARNTIALKAIKGDYDYVFYVDSDMTFKPDILENLLRDAESLRLDVIGALCFRRQIPTRPVISKEMTLEQTENGFKSHEEPYIYYPENAIVKVDAIGFGACLVSTKVLKRITRAYKTAPFTPLPTLGEDYSFCYRARECGHDIFCDTSVKCGHIGTWIYDEDLFKNQVIEDGTL